MPARVMAAVWGAGLAVIVGVAVLGGRAVTEPSAPAGLDTSALTLASPVPAAASAAPGVAAQDGTTGLRIDEPAAAGEVVTSRDLVVRGTRAGPSGEIRIILESSGGKPIATETIPASGAGGAFVVAFPLSNPRPGGEMVVQVVAYDPQGIPLDVVRRRFVVGEIVRRVEGEDGLVGGIVFDTNTAAP